MAMHGLVSNKEWILKVDSVEFANDIKLTGITHALIDSGTSLIVLPAEQFNLVLKNLSSKNYCESSSRAGAAATIRCACPTGEIKGDSFHALKIKIGSIDYELLASDYIRMEGSVCEV